jgi:hypothetical protein
VGVHTEVIGPRAIDGGQEGGWGDIACNKSLQKGGPLAHPVHILKKTPPPGGVVVSGARNPCAYPIADYDRPSVQTTPIRWLADMPSTSYDECIAGMLKS